jgi:glycine/D-amino acid oxidase-like deaminating enzyme
LTAKLGLAERDKLQNWAIQTFLIFEKMAADKELAATAGVQMRMCTSLFTEPVLGDELNICKLKQAKRLCTSGFSWTTKLIEKYGINANVRGGLVDAYEHLAPIIDTDVAMKFLMQLVADKGANFHTRTIEDDLLDIEEELLWTYKADIIINSVGLAHKTAADDSSFPVRGALLRVINDGSSFPKIENATIISAETKSGQIHQGMAFVVPRSDNILVLGSIEQPNETELSLTLESDAVKQIRRRCEDLLPVLRNAKLDPDYPLAQGLRPYRRGGVRLEQETRKRADGGHSRVVHCYGHGGGGWSISFGSGQECVNVVENVLHQTA